MKTQELKLSDTVCFKSVDTDEVFILVGSYSRTIYYSQDGEIYFELKYTGFSGTSSFSGKSEKAKVFFEDPHHLYEGVLERNEGTLYLDTKVFKMTDVPDSINYVPLPNIRIPEYLFLLERSNTYLYVSADKYYYSYDAMKLFVGLADEMRQVQILSFIRYRDGGTTEIVTAQGMLFSPIPHDTSKNPTWDGEPVKMLNPEDFEIEETDEVVKIKPKK